MAELIITEKPSAAKKMAFALADKPPKKENIRGVPYYRLTHKGREIIVASAVGHLFTVSEKEKTPWSVFPVFDVKWVPTSEVEKSADYSKKYLNVIKRLAKEADSCTVACDYDIEGEVIGLNIVRYVCKREDAARMKFSTLTKPDLIQAYEKKSKSLDWGQANAGETRHILDFYYGINLTRALTGAINKQINGFKVISSGRVQGPALKIIVDREKLIRAFIPEPYWQIELKGAKDGSRIVAMHIADKFWKKEDADRVMLSVGTKKEARVSSVKKRGFKQAPPFPFDLTSLQLEAYRCFRIKPKHTLDIAQTLYTEGLISYPRTSSQKLPKQLGFRKIITQLASQETYASLAKKILKTPLVPNEGKKTDDAHPAIYPTGLPAEGLNSRDQKLYDLIVKRFFAVFAEPAKRETNTIILDVNGEDFIAKGTVTVYKGWHEFYAPYVKLDEKELPKLEQDDSVDIKRISLLAKETKPPSRYTQSSIIHELEKKGLGTKATRATIVETLFARGYVVGDSNIEATELGIQTSDTLEKYSPEMVDEVLTRHFEEEMELIRKGKKTPEQILEEAKAVLTKIIEKFRKKEGKIGTSLSAANQEAIKKAVTLGKCPKCDDGMLVIKRGKFGRFAACTNYPDCKATYPLPRTGTVTPTKKLCEACGMPLVRAKQPNKSPQEICLNTECPSKVDGGGKKFPEEGMECPNCKAGRMILRTSFYGQFLGCDNYPKCKTMMRIIDGKVDTTPVVPVSRKKSAKKKRKKASGSAKKASKKKALKKKSS